MSEQFGIMRLEKFGRSGIYGIGLERNRTPETTRNFKNNVDPTRTEFNITLRECLDFNQAISKQIQKAGVKERPDSIVLVGAVFTATDSFFARNPHYIELTAEQKYKILNKEMAEFRTKEQRQKYLYDENTKSYFKDCLSFYIKQYCQGDSSRIISAKIDLDEDTPHMQIYSVPIQTRKNSKGIEKNHLCAKQILGNRTDLRQSQDLFFETVSKKYNLNRGKKVDWDISYLERAKNESAYEYNLKEKESTILMQEEKLVELQKELEKSQSKLQKQAEAYEALAKSKIKKTGFFNKDEQSFKMDIRDYQAATSQTQAVSRLLNSPIYSSKEKEEMERMAESYRQSKNLYDSKLKEINDLIEKRAYELMEQKQKSEPIKIQQLERKIIEQSYELNDIKKAITEYMRNTNQSLENFERYYGVNISNRDINTQYHSR